MIISTPHINTTPFILTLIYFRYCSVQYCFMPYRTSSNYVLFLTILPLYFYSIRSSIAPYDYIYVPYKYHSYAGIPESLYWRPEDHPSDPFYELSRLKTTHSLLEGRERGRGRDGKGKLALKLRHMVHR